MTFFGRKISAIRSTRSSGTLMAHTPALFPWALTCAVPESERNSVLFPDPVFPKIPTSTVPPFLRAT